MKINFSVFFIREEKKPIEKITNKKHCKKWSVPEWKRTHCVLYGEASAVSADSPVRPDVGPEPAHAPLKLVVSSVRNAAGSAVAVVPHCQ